MTKIKQATAILKALGLPRGQQNERSALTLLALANVGKATPWAATDRRLLRTVDMMQFMREQYRKVYAPNSRETIRRQTLHQFEQARIVDRNPDDPNRPTNSGNTVSQLTEAATEVLSAFSTAHFDVAVAQVIARHGSLQEAYVGRRNRAKLPLTRADGSKIYLSPGIYDQLQIEVIREFGPRLAGGSVLLYLGDTASKHVVFEAAALAALKIPVTEHDKLPDIIFYLKKNNWLFLVEAVTSHGPVSLKRNRELEFMLKECSAKRIYVTAFPDLKTFRKYAGEIAWETEVWIADMPEHMIHFNGTKFLGPY